MKSGDTLGHYRIDKRLGVGGMGEVYLAVDTKLNRPVALKTLRKEFFSDSDRQQRFIQEARAASALDHPNIVTIHDIAEYEGLPFIVMQYVSGESLGELIRKRALDRPKALEYAVQMAEGLARAHQEGIVHRDLKPDNVMVSDEGRVKIVDFGLAKLTEPLGEAPGGESPTRDLRRPLTREGEILGTGAYMSPEQALGKDIDARSDIFSFGSVLYEMVTGEQAFPGESIASVLAAIMRDEPRRVSELQPTVPSGLEAVIERALVKNRENRFQTMEELQAALEEIKEERRHQPVHSQIVQVGEFEVDLEAAELRRDDRKVKLQGKPFEILAILLERPGRVVSREELFKRLWPSDTFVDFDNSVNAAINKLRAALEDSAVAPRYVETVPRRGYRFVGPVQFADGTKSAALEPIQIPAPVPRSSMKHLVWVAGTVSAVALVVLGLRLFQSSTVSLPPAPKMRPLTSFEGGEYDPALSRDGTKVAFVWDGGTPGGDVQLYVKLIDGTDVLQLTQGPGSAILPAWSPDGQQIAFLRGMGWAPRLEVFVVSALGGQGRRIGEMTSMQTMRHKLSWSPDGKSLAIVDESGSGSSESIYSLSLETGERQQLTSPASGLFDSSPTFSPDGETVAFIRSQVPGLGAGADIYRVSATGGEEVRLTSGENAWGLDWTPDGREVIYSNIGSFGQSGLRSVTRDGDQPQRLAFGANAGHITIARNADVLAYMEPSLEINIWRVGGPAAEQQVPPERLISSTYWDFHPRYSPDGSRVAFVTSRSGEFEVWSCDGNGQDCGRVGQGWEPAWSPDGVRLAFALATEREEPGVFVIEAAGGFPRRLTQGPVSLPSWSRDGRFVYFGSLRTGRAEIWKVPADGGKAEQITQNGGINAFESEDGRFVYFARHPWPPRSKIWKVPVEGGEETLVLDKEPDFRDWGLWNGNLVYLNPEGKNGPAIELLELDTKEIREVVALSGRRNMGGGVSVGLTISPDGRWISYVQMDGASSDLMLVENFR